MGKSINAFTDERLQKELIKHYSVQSGIDVDDPVFWDKFDAWIQKIIDEENLKELPTCSHCGQEM